MILCVSWFCLFFFLSCPFPSGSDPTLKWAVHCSKPCLPDALEVNIGTVQLLSSAACRRMRIAGGSAPNKPVLPVGKPSPMSAIAKHPEQIQVN